MLINTVDLKIRIRALEILLFQNDLREVDDWIEELESLHHELGVFFSMEKKLLREDKFRYELLAWRRVNTLEIAGFCKYQQSIRTQMNYSKNGYCEAWIKTHEKQRNHYKDHLRGYRETKIDLLKNLMT